MKCQACRISIGDSYIEYQAYSVGNYRICGWCRNRLIKYGRLQVVPYSDDRYLLPDGQVVIDKAINSEVLFNV